MKKIEEARKLLQALQMPAKQQSDLCCYVLLAMANIGENDKWSASINPWMRIHDVLIFIREDYGITYAENSRETFRKQAMHHFRNAALIEDNGLATNSPNYRYRLTDEVLILIRSYNTPRWDRKLSDFQKHHESLVQLYSSKRNVRKMPVRINGQRFTFSPGAHNHLQKEILEEFAPRFAPNCECLYVGDTIKKDMVKNEAKLQELGFSITLHDTMPDVVLYIADKNWIMFIEAVTSVGPMSPQRVNEIEEMTKEVISRKSYITAFPDFKTYKKFSASLAWETEVWIAEEPNHMIHLNGDKFLNIH